MRLAKVHFARGLVAAFLVLSGTVSHGGTDGYALRSAFLANPTVQKKTHMHGNQWLTVSNWGQFGAEHDIRYYSCVFPAGSDMEYLFWGGLWLGALVGDDTLVSTGCEGWSGAYSVFYPTDDPGDTIIERSILPGSPYYDTLAVSEQDFCCAYSDTYTDPDLVGEDHRPLGIKVYQKTYVFSHPAAEDIVFLDFTIANIGTFRLRDLYMGLYIDGDCGPFGFQYSYYKAQDDVTGFRRWATLARDTLWNHRLRTNTAWTANACRIGLIGNCYGIETPDVTGARVLISPNPRLHLAYNWWFSDQSPVRDWGPWNPENPKDSLLQIYAQHRGQPEPGTPVLDGEKWLLMSNQESDPDQVEGVVGGPHADTVFDDTRYVISFGPVFTAPDSTFPPGDSVRLILAHTGGECFQIYDFPPAPGTPSEDWYGFADLALNAQSAMDICDNPGVDTDPSDTLYPWYVINPNTGDTVWMGDGVPDFKVPTGLPSPGLVTGGGWVPGDPPSPDNKKTFGFNVSFECGRSTGQLQFVDHATKLNVHSDTIKTVLIHHGDTIASLSGHCRVSEHGGQLVLYSFECRVMDRGEPGRGVDWFSLDVYDGNGDLHYSAGDYLGGGNIQVHTESNDRFGSDLSGSEGRRGDPVDPLLATEDWAEVGVRGTASCQNSPNPFCQFTFISYRVPKVKAGSRDLIHVSLRLYDLSGRLVETLVNESREPGVYRIRWQREGKEGGVYFYRLEAAGLTATGKMIVLR